MSTADPTTESAASPAAKTAPEVEKSEVRRVKSDGTYS
jgi:hypothetical protein